MIPTLWLSFRRQEQKGARINYGNSTVDRWGYGVTSALSPYHENRIALDINDLENDVELKSTSTVAVPRQGAVVFADFETVQGQSAIMNIVRSDGKNIPFAADIYDEQNNIIGNVGQGVRPLFAASPRKEIYELPGLKRANQSVVLLITNKTRHQKK